MRLLVTMVTHNEADRYLRQCLEWVKGFTDGIAILDDESDDLTVQIAKELGCRVGSRNAAIPPFMEDESAVREAALRFLEFAFEPKDGDWILSLDADEFLVADGPERQVIEENITVARGYDGLIIPVAETFGMQASTPLIRTDAYWARITALRLFAWHPNGRFERQPLGGGSTPSYVRKPVFSTGLDILHMGYARPEDRQVKHDRYAAKPGHNPKHVASILHPPTMIRWGKKVPWA